MTDHAYTLADLHKKVDRINHLTGMPKEQYANNNDGTFTPNVGNYHLDFAYGGVKLCQMCESGGTREISTIGYAKKKELGQWLDAYIHGLQTKLNT